MIHIRARRQEDGMELSAVGHASYAPRGQDIVCAGVSALLYGFIAYLESLSPIATEGAAASGEVPHLQVTESDGGLWVRTHGLGGGDIRGWEVTEAGLCRIASAYPACVAVERGEVSPQERKGADNE